MKNENLKIKLKKIINSFNELNNSYPDRLVSQIQWKETHKKLLELKPYFIENLETDEESLAVILDNINDKVDNGETLNEIENITGNYITFIYHVEAIFLKCVGIKINEKSEEQQELEELNIL